MRKAGFIGSVVSVLFGAALLVTTSVINEVMPIIGRLAFQRAVSGSYSTADYIMNFSFADTAAVILIVFGLIFGVYCFVSEIRSERR